MPRTRPRATVSPDSLPEGRDACKESLNRVDRELRDLNDRIERGYEPSDGEWRDLDAKLDLAAALRGKVESYDRIATAANTPAGHSGDGARDFQYQRRVDWRLEDPERVAALSDSEARSKGLAVLEHRGRDLSAGQADHLDALIRADDRNCDGSYIARRAAITESDEYRRAFNAVLTQANPVLTDAEARALRSLPMLERAMGVITSSAGGYGVPVIIDPTIILTDQGSANPFWTIGNVKTITTKDWKGVSAAGVSFAFETEAAAANDLTPTLAQPTVYAHRVQGAIPFSIEVGMDYPNFAAEIGEVLRSGYDDITLNKFTTGSGTGEPWGIFEACEQATSQVVVGTDAQLHAADINKVFAALPQRWRQNASWVMSIDVNQDIQALGDDKLATQTVDMRAGAIDRLKNRPVYESSYAPNFTATTGAASIAVVGDFSQFVIAQRAGMNIELVQNLVDTTTGLPTGQRAFFAWARVGSDAVVDNAFRMLVNT